MKFNRWRTSLNHVTFQNKAFSKLSIEIKDSMEPMTVEEFVESIKMAEYEIDNGDFDSIDDFENRSSQWD